ncbi:hypothetical protein [Ktedonobacter robiniae]|uniref:Uncharacterized protein n=1 Tax=Ktedonobacter robiniae TaxID=2778365 RepID=A0ABQ3ULC8_9CHLR|nr:hypothetical protein [Ktedonobacter robiniae]GHO53498.1 hypothetical protein KSB_19730 [Ktedonobacter robiniae]
MNWLNRGKAALCVLLLVGIAAVLVLGITQVASAQITAGATQHAQGKIVSLTGSEKDFLLRVSDGHVLHFRCGTGCNASLAHIRRHITEKATTDVYYQTLPEHQGEAQQLLALYVD